ncbi:MAG TPA: response regulator [Pyrinomonadaceae bacterium]|jgi:CheY-like chemotaxis protein|nr:response regulator [Pyrinomonadaceae bacterium]
MQVTLKPSVLIADDSADTRDLLRFWLESKRCRVLEATNGQEAVDLTRDECPDLILMELLMPVLDGAGATRRIREHAGGRDIPIVAMSSHPSEEARANALAAGCGSFVPHPLDLEQLGDLLSRLLPASTLAPARAMVATLPTYVVNHYNKLGQLNLTAQDKRDLVEFLKSL